MSRLSLTVVVIVFAAAPVCANDEQDCFQGQEPEQRIKGCSVIIERAPKDATAYHNRAVAYELAGEIDNAIADYTKTIEITPDNASAYDNRGRAYASKGNYASGLADATKASQLIAKARAQETGITPKITKKAKTTAARTRATTVSPKTKASPKASNSVDKEAAQSSWWSWFWGDSADQSRGKKGKR